MITDNRARGDLFVSPSFTVGNKELSFLEQERDLPQVSWSFGYRED